MHIEISCALFNWNGGNGISKNEDKEKENFTDNGSNTLENLINDSNNTTFSLKSQVDVNISHRLDLLYDVSHDN